MTYTKPPYHHEILKLEMSCFPEITSISPFSFGGNCVTSGTIMFFLSFCQKYLAATIPTPIKKIAIAAYFITDKKFTTYIPSCPSISF